MTRNLTFRPALGLVTAVILAASVLPASAFMRTEPPLAVKAKPDRLVTHLAVYELTLTENSSSSGISDLRGRIVYELTGSDCIGYTVNMRIVNQVADTDGSGGVTDLRSSAWESADGTKFRFNSTEYLDSELNETTSGSASRNAAKAVSVNLEKPARKGFAIERDVSFPLEHLLEIIRAAQDGHRIVERRVYDGSQSGDKIFKTTTIIGTGNRSSKEPGVTGATQLLKAAAWPVSIAYYEENKAANEGEQTPSYQLSFRLFDNGVSDRLVLDYGNFTLRGELKSIKQIAPVACE